MSEEQVKEAVQEPVEQVEVNPVEEQAREQGWVSKDEWVKDGKNADEWRSAKEFVERGEIFKSLSQVKRELKQTKESNAALIRHNQYVFEKAYNKALNDLKAERRQALREGELEVVAEVEDRIEALEEQKKQEQNTLVQTQQVAAASGVHPVFQEWVNRNQWYNQDGDMREFAEAVGQIYINKNPQAAPEDVLRHVESKVKKQYSEKFGGRRAAPSAVAGVDRTSQRATGGELILDEMEMQIMKTLVGNGDLTEAEYKAQLKKAKGL